MRYPDTEQYPNPEERATVWGIGPGLYGGQPVPRKPMTRVERRAATRADLLEAAARVFARHGLNGASVDDVASEAGYTSGAVYSNFAGKEELFVAAFEHEVARQVREVIEARDHAGEDTPRARTAAIAARWMHFLEGRPEMFVLMIEYWGYAIRNREQRPGFAERFGAFRDATTRLVEEEAQRGGWDLPIPARDIALGLNALVYGMAIQYLADPGDMPEGVLANVTHLVFGGVREWNAAERAEEPDGPTA
jgi:AcrR family transcriptional regulator